MIKLTGVKKSYGDEIVLRGIDLHVHHTESHIILGGNGSGKSTILKLIAGLERCDEGKIELMGKDITNMKEEGLYPLRRKIGIVFQEGALFDSLTIKENVAYRLYDEGGWEEDEIEEVVLKLLSFVGLEHTMDMMPSELSGGMRRRVAIARALVGEPKILLYDEPTAGLDPITSRAICDLMVKLRDLEGVASVVVTNDLNAAFFLSGFVASAEARGDIELKDENDEICFIHTHFSVLKDGYIIFNGGQKEMMECKDPFVREFIT